MTITARSDESGHSPRVLQPPERQSKPKTAIEHEHCPRLVGFSSYSQHQIRLTRFTVVFVCNGHANRFERKTRLSVMRLLGVESLVVTKQPAR